MRPLPGDLEHHGVGALRHLRDRSRRVGERFLPSLACLDDLIRTLDFALGHDLFVHRVRAQRRLAPLPVSRAERFNALFRQAHLVCTHRGPPLLTLDSDWPGFLAERTPGCKTRRLRAGWSKAARAGHGSDEDGLGRHVGQRHRALVDELPRVEAVVEAAAREELRVRALLDDAAPVEHQDPVRALDRRQPVRDHDRRAATHQTVKGLLNEEFALVVERAGGLVEEKDPGVAKDRPGDGDALPLSDRQPDTASNSISPRTGPIGAAPGRSRTSASVSSRAKIRSAAPNACWIPVHWLARPPTGPATIPM